MNNSIKREDIMDLLSKSEAAVSTVHDKCTIVSVKLENGFVITESSACVDPENYSEEIGFNECLKKIESRLWELEGYALQKKLYEEGIL